MIISYKWLQEYCPFDMAAHELAERLSHSGLNVETYEPADGDWMLDVEVTSNRPDCLSHIGIAREVAAFIGKTVTHPAIELREDDGLSFEELSSVRVDCPELCPHYTARMIKDVEVVPSPEWMQERLRTCGVRPVNNIVDITNYVLLESGQPLHAFDISLLNEERIIVRRATEGETMVAIDGTECTLSPEICVIADAANPVAVAGVMGGVESEINDATTDVLLESARFNPPNIRRTSRALGLSSESSYRFERGVDPENVERASRRAAQLLVEHAGGKLAQGLADIRSDTTETPAVTMRFGRLSLVLGIEVPPAEVRSIFEGLELNVQEQTDQQVTVTSPSWRADLTREVDLIEEVARIHGYDKISETTRIPVRSAPVSERHRCEQRARNLLAGEGFTEVLTYSLITPASPQLQQPWHKGGPIELRNPVSSDKTHMRLSCMANLLETKRFNAAHGVEKVDIFELSKVYVPGAENELPGEKLCLSLLTDREDGFFVLKGVLANLLDALHVDAAPRGVPAEIDLFGAEPSLELRLDGQLLGCIGIVKPETAEACDLASRPALMELDFDVLIRRAAVEPTVRPVPRFPAVERDIAVVVEESVRWADLEACLRENAPEHLEDIEFFDIYRGEQIPEGHKSIAFSVTFRAPDRTLTGAEADAERDHIVAALADQIGARLR